MIFFADSDKEAEARFKRYYDHDPFPGIPQALLNSTDIRSYVGATGMIYPFESDDKKFKTASYEVDLLGKCVYWDDDGKKITKIVKKGDEFILRRNSIAFVTLEPMFRLPQYIAMRFNLKITHVYRGILLGTGPLVDPGYCNRLSMPLHNLTTNDYVFTGGEGLIWMEFTKLSHLVGDAKDPGGTVPQVWQGKIVGFPKQKNELDDVEDYIRKGEPHRPVRSSIPEVFHDAAATAEAARVAVKRFEQRFERIGIVAAGIAIVALVVAIIFGVFPIVSLVHDVNKTAIGTREQLEIVKQQVEDQQKKEKQVQTELQYLRNSIENAKPQVKSEGRLLSRGAGKAKDTKSSAP